MGTFWIEDGQTMLFIGDSITDCGRRGTDIPLGNGYVRYFAELTTGLFPERKIRYLNKGIGGHKVTDLKERWTDDVIYNRPDRLSIKIGINDLHSHLRGVEGAVSPQQFLKTYDALLACTRDELNCQVLLVTPFYISTDRSRDNFRGQVLSLLPSYIACVEELSVKYDTRMVNLHEVFQKQLLYRDVETFCPEPVHPNQAGHVIIADKLLRSLIN